MTNTFYLFRLSGGRTEAEHNDSEYEDVANFKHLGTTLTDQNYGHEEIKSRKNSENACCHLVQSLLSRLLSRNVKVKIYMSVILTGFFMSVKLGLSR
jgi:hypothetical protein